MVTILKNTTKFVTDVPFPALTICGSGLHMSNVEKKVIKDFREWRTQNKKDLKNKDAIKEDMGQFMEERFQIKPNQTATVNILDILDMMITPDVDASVAVNSIRENDIACRQDAKDHSSSLLSCPHPS